jgi:hypothetical protein
MMIGILPYYKNRITKLLKAMQGMMETYTGSQASQMDIHQAKTDANRETLAKMDANHA